MAYVDIDEAKEYLEARFKTMPEDEALERALLLANDKIEMLDVRNRGEVTVFPRIGEEDVPLNVKIAEIMEAYCIALAEAEGVKILQTSAVAASNNVGMLKSVTIDDMTKTYETGGSASIKTITSPIESFLSVQAKQIMERYVRKTYGWG